MGSVTWFGFLDKQYVPGDAPSEKELIDGVYANMKRLGLSKVFMDRALTCDEVNGACAAIERLHRQTKRVPVKGSKDAFLSTLIRMMPRTPAPGGDPLKASQVMIVSEMMDFRVAREEIPKAMDIATKYLGDGLGDLAGSERLPAPILLALFGILWNIALKPAAPALMLPVVRACSAGLRAANCREAGERLLGAALVSAYLHALGASETNKHVSRIAKAFNPCLDDRDIAMEVERSDLWPQEASPRGSCFPANFFEARSKPAALVIAKTVPVSPKDKSFFLANFPPADSKVEVDTEVAVAFGVRVKAQELFECQGTRRVLEGIEVGAFRSLVEFLDVGNGILRAALSNLDQEDMTVKVVNKLMAFARFSRRADATMSKRSKKSGLQIHTGDGPDPYRFLLLIPEARDELIKAFSPTELLESLTRAFLDLFGEYYSDSYEALKTGGSPVRPDPSIALVLEAMCMKVLKFVNVDRLSVEDYAFKFYCERREPFRPFELSEFGTDPRN